jgi:stress-induced morphogen
MAAMAEIAELETLLRDAFPEATEVRVTDRTGGGDHFLIEVTTARFDSLPLVDQHRLVNEALAAPFASGRIHEMRIRTKGAE